jgi:A/G-specific adenine glycosylase
MLQQTRVETAIPYYGRFLERFPDIESLAGAEPEEVYGLWAGLGYYSRARNLHAAARRVVEEHGGRFPDDAEALRALPGVGRYTAGAVASIAFDRPEPAVDGNVTRVLSRLLGIREDIGAKPVQERLWEEAALLARGPRPGDLNQALMELGATLCSARSPHCKACPLSKHCDAAARGDAESLPLKGRPKPPQPMRAAAAWVARRGKVLAVRRPEGGLLGGLWELPGGELGSREGAASGLARVLQESVGLKAEAFEQVGTVEHGFTHRKLRLHVFRCDGVTGRVRLRGLAAHRWLAPAGLSGLAQGGPTRKALALLNGSGGQRMETRRRG